MLTGKQLGAAINEAIRRSGKTKVEVARHFGIKPPSISDWCKRGTVGKDKLDELFRYFSPWCDSAHWGIRQHMLAINEPEPAPYHPKVTTISQREPWAEELLELARAMNPDGRRELIGMARLLANIHPKPKAKRS